MPTFPAGGCLRLPNPQGVRPHFVNGRLAGSAEVESNNRLFDAKRVMAERDTDAQYPASSNMQRIRCGFYVEKRYMAERVGLLPASPKCLENKEFRNVDLMLCVPMLWPTSYPAVRHKVKARGSGASDLSRQL